MDNIKRPGQSGGRPNRVQDIHREVSDYPLINQGSQKMRRIKKGLVWTGIVVLALALAVAGYFAFKHFDVTQPDKSTYQAVFLTNGQVYFGKLDKVNQSYVQLTDIFYLQANQSLQATPADAQSAAATTNDASKMQLIKLGSELHGPKDMMHINHDQVLFWEDLKPNSKVSEAIVSYKSP